MEEGFFECTLFWCCYEKTAYVTETLESPKNLKVLEMISLQRELNVTSRMSRDIEFASELRNLLQNLSFWVVSFYYTKHL